VRECRKGMSDLTQSTIAFVQVHEGWLVPVVFVLAFCESFAFISLVVPATAILFGLGGLIGTSGVEFWPVWLSAALGAVVGDWLAYSLAFYLRDRIVRLWPFSRDPAIVARGMEFFERWGTMAVFMGRFLGPFRAIVPIAAGIHAMPWLKFQAANGASAVVWATGILAPGSFGMRWLLG
jgi:membrane protein DedA with SNARE-associated domain